jgi:hypothetical protein
MAIGDPITEPIPAVGEAGTGYATKLVNFISEVKTRLESQVPLTSLLAGLFDLSNNAVANASYVSLYEQVSVPSTPVGSLQRYGGEVYYVSPSGAVRITNGGVLDIAATGGITGDYAAPAEFKYVLADTEFYAYSNQTAGPKEWAYVGARAFDIYGTLTSTTRVRIAWAGGSSYTLTLPTAVPGAQALVHMSAAGQLTASNSLAADASLTVSGTGDFKHGEKTMSWAFGDVSFATFGSLVRQQWSAGPPRIFCTTLNAGGVAVVQIPLRAGWRVKKLTFTASTANEPAANIFTIQNYDSATSYATTVAGTFVGTSSRAYSFDSPPTAVAGDVLTVDMTAGGSEIDFADVTLTYDIP